jgi:hypothetical protein
MRLILFTFPLAIALGYLLGGRLENLGGVRFRYAPAGVAGVALQFLPVGGTPGYLLLIVSFLLLLFVASVNWKLPGFLLVLLGLSSNFLVIAVNEGMPVSAEAIVSSGQTDTLDEISGGNRHHLATPDDTLLFLADVIAVPEPVGQAVSVGDVVAYAGALWFVVAAMRGQSDENERVGAGLRLFAPTSARWGGRGGT